jgi:hypothetical protein
MIANWYWYKQKSEFAHTNSCDSKKKMGHVQVESLEGLNERLTEARVRADSLSVQVQDSQERREGSRIQLLTSQARELQYLMEEEIEANNYEAAALLQVRACVCQVCACMCGRAPVPVTVTGTEVTLARSSAPWPRGNSSPCPSLAHPLLLCKLLHIPGLFLKFLKKKIFATAGGDRVHSRAVSAAAAERALDCIAGSSGDAAARAC